jgi:hypothetical protein
VTTRSRLPHVIPTLEECLCLLPAPAEFIEHAVITRTDRVAEVGQGQIDGMPFGGKVFWRPFQSLSRGWWLLAGNHCLSLATDCTTTATLPWGTGSLFSLLSIRGCPIC